MSGADDRVPMAPEQEERLERVRHACRGVAC
jgi:hypothetical protein